MGSKSRVAKDILPFIQHGLSLTENTYIETFCGGCNMLDKVQADKRFAYDLNPYLIGLFKHIQVGASLLEEVPRELYGKVREHYKEGIYEDWYVGNIGFLASYNGRFFDGGYAPPGYEKTKTGIRYRDYYREARDNILKQNVGLKDVVFECKDYLEHDFHNITIYCDPPYASQKKYDNALAFDYEKFWSTMRKWSVYNVVLISEQTAPEDFICLWEKEVSRSIKAADKTIATEKLFIYKDSPYLSAFRVFIKDSDCLNGNNKSLGDAE